MKTNELKCTDLRIGNLIDYFGDIIKVDTIDYFDGKERVGGKTKDEDRVFDKPSYFDPIELTEEVLLKIGFGKRNDCYTLSNEYIFFVYYKDSFKQELLASVKRKGKYYYNTNELKNYDIKYLHQLQNAYYCLTGEELEVEL